MIESLNTTTQPRMDHPIFNNWDVVSQGWYIALPCKALKCGEARSVDIASQHIVFYRGQSGNVYALDGFCPHMGVDLGLGCVIGESLQCKFHHWQFNALGRCIDIPCGENVPSNVGLNHYAVEEKYGYIWIWPSDEADCPVLDIPGLESADLAILAGDPYERPCHHHITMVNGIDAQHLNSVHNLGVSMTVDIKENPKNHLTVSLKGTIFADTPREKLFNWFLGGHYCYSMSYAHGTIGALTMMKDVSLFRRFKVPQLHMIYAYTPHKNHRTKVTPLYITQKRAGFFGPIKSFILLRITKMLFYFLKEEDGNIYENIRFNTTSFLKIDKPIAQYVAFINRLKPSAWSTPAVECNV